MDRLASDSGFFTERTFEKTFPCKLTPHYFRRISYGVQDLNREVQEAIHLIQPFENLRRATEDAMDNGFIGVNFYLIYGLPRQTPDELHHTIAQSVGLQPDRLAKRVAADDQPADFYCTSVKARRPDADRYQ